MKTKDSGKDVIKFILECIKGWRSIPRERRVDLLRNGRYNPVKTLKPEHAVANVVVTIYEVLYRFKRLCSATNQDEKLVAYVDFSKALDPHYGYLALRLSELALVLQTSAYTKKDIDTLKEYFAALYFVLLGKVRRCGRANLAALRNIFENVILPALASSTPKDSTPHIAACYAGFARMSETLRAIAQSIRASLSIRAKVRQGDGDLEAYLAHQVVKSKAKKKPVVAVEGYRSLAEWDENCTVANLEPKHHSRYGGARDKLVHHTLNGFKHSPTEITISNHKGYVLYAIGRREYRFVRPSAIAFMDFLIEANLSDNRGEGYVLMPIPLDKEGNQKPRSQFRNYEFKNKSATAPFKEANFWDDHIIAPKKDGHKGPPGMVRLGEPPEKPA